MSGASASGARSEELLRARCGQGWFVVTATEVRTELNHWGGGAFKSSRLLRSEITGMDVRRTPISGATHLVFHGRGSDRLRVTNLRRKDGDAALAALQSSSSQQTATA